MTSSLVLHRVATLPEARALGEDCLMCGGRAVLRVPTWVLQHTVSSEPAGVICDQCCPRTALRELERLRATDREATR